MATRFRAIGTITPLVIKQPIGVTADYSRGKLPSAMITRVPVRAGRSRTMVL